MLSQKSLGIPAKSDWYMLEMLRGIYQSKWNHIIVEIPITTVESSFLFIPGADSKRMISEYDIKFCEKPSFH